MATRATSTSSSATACSRSSAPPAARTITPSVRCVPLEIASGQREESESGLEIGIGLNTGTVLAGNVGGGGRLEFSVIGDAVNVAARVEACTRDSGDAILVTESTREAIGDGDVEFEERSAVELKGKREAVALYAPRVDARISS